MTLNIGRICLAYLYLYTTIAEGTTANFANMSFTGIPWSMLSTQDDVVDASYNLIVELGAIPTNTNVISLSLAQNQLVSFPNLTNLSTTLKFLNLGYNRISDIFPPSLLTVLSEVTTLDVTGTDLVSLPDVKYFPPKLKMFYIRETRITSLPNMCQLDVSERFLEDLVLIQEGVGYNCDIAMVWTHLAYRAELLSILGVGFQFGTYPECTAPERLRDTLWYDISMEDFLDRDPQMIQNVFRKLDDPSHFYCYPHISEIRYNATRMQCAVGCLNKPKCVMFAIDNGNCILSEFRVEFGTEADFKTYGTWYLV